MQKTSIILSLTLSLYLAACGSDTPVDNGTETETEAPGGTTGTQPTGTNNTGNQVSRESTMYGLVVRCLKSVVEKGDQLELTFACSDLKTGSVTSRPDAALEAWGKENHCADPVDFFTRQPNTVSGHCVLQMGISKKMSTDLEKMKSMQNDSQYCGVTTLPSKDVLFNRAVQDAIVTCKLKP
jgi:hypothetical protein